MSCSSTYALTVSHQIKWKQMDSHSHMTRYAYRMRTFICIGVIVAAIPIVLGAAVFVLAAYVGFPKSFAALTQSGAWLKVVAVMTIHIALAGFSVSLAIATLRRLVRSAFLWVGTLFSLLAMCTLAMPVVSGDLLFIRYSWPSFLTTSLLLLLSYREPSPNELSGSERGRLG